MPALSWKSGTERLLHNLNFSTGAAILAAAALVAGQLCYRKQDGRQNAGATKACCGGLC
jgi:hypothetical protein